MPTTLFRSIASTTLALTILAMPAFAGRLFMLPQGVDPSAADATAGSNFPVNAQPGDILTFDVYIQDPQAPLLWVQVQYSCDGVLQADWPVPARYVPLSIQIDDERDDFLFAGTPYVTALDRGQCEPDIPCSSDSECNANSLCRFGSCTIAPPRSSSLVLNSPPIELPDETRYVAELTYSVPEVAWGTAVIRPICCRNDADCDGDLDEGCAQVGSDLQLVGPDDFFTAVDGIELNVNGPLQVAHQQGESGQTEPFSGYIDPRADLDASGNPTIISSATIRFSKPVFGSENQDPVTAANFTIATTGGELPDIASIDMLEANQTIFRLNFDRNIPLQHWTTVTANVFDIDGNPIENVGSLGAADEPDRLDLSALPGDIDQNGIAEPADVFQFRKFINAVDVPEQGALSHYLDIDRNGTIEPLDLFRLRQVLQGVDFASQPWAGQSLLAPRP